MHRSVLQQRNRYILLVIAFLLVFSLFLTSEYWYEQTLRRLAETPSLKTSFWESSSYRYESPTLPDSTTDPSEEKYDEEVNFEEDEDENDIGRRPLNDLPVNILSLVTFYFLSIAGAHKGRHNGRTRG